MGNQITLTPVDKYYLARKLARLDVQGLEPSPGVKLLVSGLETTAQDDSILQRILAQVGIANEILAIDPNKPPQKPKPVALTTYVPDLPDIATLPDTALKQAETAGSWLDDFQQWSTSRSPMTPPHFLQLGGVWAIGLICARRCALKLSHAAIYPHLYLLWVASTSVYRKSTGLQAVSDLVDRVAPHLLLPEQTSPESLLFMLSGKMPENWEDLPKYQKEIEKLGSQFAGQRGVIIDEASRLFIAKDYMKGIMETLMELYDGKPQIRRHLRSTGLLVIAQPALSILGATTPAALARNVTWDMWENGLFARFLLLVPDHIEDYVRGSVDDDYLEPPADLVNRLKTLDAKLPDPPTAELFDDEPPRLDSIPVTISFEAHEMYQNYSQAVGFELLKPDGKVDERLRGNYSRLPMQAVKIAVCLAAIDYADGADSIRVTAGHWARAQMLTEGLRTQLHETVRQVSETLDAKGQNRVLDVVKSFPQGITVRDICRSTGMTSKQVYNALEVLMDSGLVYEQERIPETGRPTKTYLEVV